MLCFKVHLMPYNTLVNNYFTCGFKICCEKKVKTMVVFRGEGVGAKSM